MWVQFQAEQKALENKNRKKQTPFTLSLPFKIGGFTLAALLLFAMLAVSQNYLEMSPAHWLQVTETDADAETKNPRPRNPS